MFDRKETITKLFQTITPDDLNSLPARWKKECSKRTHLLSLNSLILDSFKRDLNPIAEWVVNLGFRGLEIRMQDLFGFQGELDQSRIESLQNHNLIYGFHLSDWAYWVCAWKNDFKSLEEIFGNRKNAESYFGGWGKEDLLKRWEQELKIAALLKPAYIVFHSHEIDLDCFFTNTFRHTQKEVINSVKEALGNFKKKDLSIENGNTFSQGVRSTADFLLLPPMKIVIDVSHLESVVLEKTFQRGREAFEKNLLDEAEKISGQRIIQALHLSDSAFTNQRIPIEPTRIPKDFFAKREFVNGDEKFFDHLPVGTSTTLLPDFIKTVNPPYVSHELKTTDLNLLEKAILIQKHHIARNE